MSRFSATIEGNDKVLLRLSSMRSHSATAFADALEEVLDAPFQESKRLCPVDTAALVESALMKIEVNSDSVKVEISYGDDPVVPYAWFVHERMDLRHAPPTQAKFLEQPMRAILPDLSRLTAEAMKGFVK